MIRRPIIGASALGISSIQTPSKKLMRERSSPGTRRNSHAGNDGESHRMNRHKDSEFQNVYKSVERLGGIGASKSVLNLDRDRSQASQRERNYSALSNGRIKAIPEISMTSRPSTTMEPVKIKIENQRNIIEAHLTRIKHNQSSNCFKGFNIDLVRNKNMKKLNAQLPIKRKASISEQMAKKYIN